jgi:cell division transport system permease protein
MRAQFVLSEIGIGLRRNLTMTVAVVVTVAISLALFGVALLIQRQVATMKDYWYDKVEVSVYLCGNESKVSSCARGPVTAEQRQEIKTDLDALPQVKQVYYESKEEAFERFKERLEGTAIAENLTADALPESYRIKLNDPEQFEVVASALTGRPGVESVQDQRALLERFFRVLNTLQRIVIFIALFQVVAAALLISNTIRVAAFSRRRETGIMRLVGASNFYIQLPFLLEGAIAGLIGAFIASGLLAVGQYFIQDEIAPAFAFTRFVGWDALLGIIPILLVAGVVLSGTASFVTLRRYLKV